MAGELDPRTRKEVFLAGMLYGDPEDLPDPETRDELYMKAIAEVIKAGGIPDPSEASVGDVLTNGADGPEWAPPSGGVSELWTHILYITMGGGVTGNIKVAFVSDSQTFDPTTDTLRRTSMFVFGQVNNIDLDYAINQGSGAIYLSYGSSGGTYDYATSGASYAEITYQADIRLA